MSTPTVANVEKKTPKVIWPVFIFSFGLILLFIGYGLANQGNPNSLLVRIAAVVQSHVAWLYLLVTFSAWILCIGLCVSKWGNIKFGEVDDKPEFSTFTWVGMITTACLATSIMFFGSTEWVFYYTSPPFHLEPGSIEATEFAASYGMFHWGTLAWAIYVVPTLPIAYLIYNRKRTLFRVSMGMSGVFGEKHFHGNLGAFLDGLMVIGIIGGTSVGLGTGPGMINSVIGNLFGFEPGLGFDIFMICTWVLLFFLVSCLGLKKGMARLSDINIYVAIGFFALILLLGPTLTILKGLVNSIGVIGQNIFKMSLWTDPYGASNFPEDWTGFMWAWWVVGAPFTGIFLARISKGRTVRELILANIVGGAFACFIAFAILTNTAIYLEVNGLAKIVDTVMNDNLSGATSVILEALPFGSFLMVVFIISAWLFMGTTFNSIAYGASTVCSDKTAYDHEPSLWLRFAWALAIAGVAISVRLVTGLKILETGSIMTGVPILIIIALLVASFFKMAGKDRAHIIHTRYRQQQLEKDLD